MASRSKKRKPAPARQAARESEKGVKVTAVKTTSGPPATSVHVEVQPDELRGEVGDVGEVRSVSAMIPESGEPGRERWCEETLLPAGSTEQETDGRRRMVQRYFNVHYGPSDTERLGVSVTLQTDRGTVKAPPTGQAYTVKNQGQPGESELTPTEGRKKKPH